MFSFFSGGGGSKPIVPNDMWARVSHSGIIETLAAGASLSIPFTLFTGGSPHQSWLSFTTTNGTVLLDNGVYTFTWWIYYRSTGTGLIVTELASVQGGVEWIGASVGDQYDGPALLAASGYVGTDDPINLTLTNKYAADITDIGIDLGIIKVH